MGSFGLKMKSLFQNDVMQLFTEKNIVVCLTVTQEVAISVPFNFFSVFVIIVRCVAVDKDMKRQQEDHQHELKTFKNKMEANEEFLKQEHNLATVKVSFRVTSF